jgi:hypothetical protein
MGSFHSSHFFIPNWVGFALLIAVWVIFRGVLVRWRRSSWERAQLRRPVPPPASAAPIHGKICCPRCSAAAPAVAAFCPHCGLSFNSLPPPVPAAPVASRPPRNGLLLLVYVLLGIIGLAAYAFWRFGGEESEPPATLERPPIHFHSHR